jgi:hypothetical protein
MALPQFPNYGKAGLPFLMFMYGSPLSGTGEVCERVGDHRNMLPRKLGNVEIHLLLRASWYLRVCECILGKMRMYSAWSRLGLSSSV